MSETRLRIGTRGSKLALVQANLVRDALVRQEPGLEVELKVMKTRGDKLLTTPLALSGGKGLFVREIEDALLAGEVDLAVHSLKDLPSELPRGLCLGAVLPRADYRDAVVSAKGCSLTDLPPGSLVATSSLRRKAQIHRHYPHLSLMDIRGNVDTRLNKLHRGECSALILAVAGLKRAGYAQEISEILQPEIMLPAVCQGIIGIENRAADHRIQTLLDRVNHPPSMLAARAERAFLRRLEGSCQFPLGCLAIQTEGSFLVRGFLASPDGSCWLQGEAAGKGEEAEKLARRVAGRLLEEGGENIITSLQNQGVD